MEVNRFNHDSPDYSDSRLTVPVFSSYALWKTDRQGLATEIETLHQAKTVAWR
jgi:hypothetical protein